MTGSVQSDNWIGRVLANGRYHIEAKLGEGGMGSVYRARDRKLQREVVVKVPHDFLVRRGARHVICAFVFPSGRTGLRMRCAMLTPPAQRIFRGMTQSPTGNQLNSLRAKPARRNPFLWLEAWFRARYLRVSLPRLGSIHTFPAAIKA